MSEIEEMVQVNFSAILQSLETLAENDTRIKMTGVPINQIQAVPKDFPTNFTSAAGEVVEYYLSLPEDANLRKDYDLEKVQKGLELIASGKVHIEYI